METGFSTQNQGFTHMIKRIWNGPEDEEDSAELEDTSEEEELLEELYDEPDDRKEDELPSEERKSVVGRQPDRTEPINTAVINNCSFFKISLRTAK